MIFRVLVYNIYEMKVKELIEKLKEFNENEEIKFWIDNLNSSKRNDMETDILYIGYEYNIRFCDGEHEYPTRDGWDWVYIRLRDPRYF